MVIYLILGILLGGAAVMFAVENLSLVTVTFLSWQFTAPLSVVALSAVLGGIALTLLLMLPYYLRQAIGEFAIQWQKKPEGERRANEERSSVFAS